MLLKYVVPCGAIASIWLQCSPLFAQFQPLPETDPTAEAAVDLRMKQPRDPRQQAQLNLALQAMRDGHIATGLEILQSLLDRQPDFFLFEGLDITSTLRAEIDAAVLKHRDEYERLVGDKAQRLLEEAIEKHDADGLVQLVRRYELSDAGAAAVELLADLKLEAGEPGLAARLFQRLATHERAAARKGEILLKSAAAWFLAGASEQAAAQLQSDPEAVADYVNRQQLEPIPSGAEVQWLEKAVAQWVLATASAELQNWRTPYGGINHIADAEFAPPIFPGSWRRPLIDEYDMAERDALGPARQIERGIRARNDLVAMPAAVPLIVGDAVVVAGYGNLKCFDLETGEWNWPAVVVDRTFEYLFRQSYSPYAPPGEASQDVERLFFHQRGWRDSTAASLSADSERVYALTDCTLSGTVAGGLALQNPVRSPVLPDRSNLLRAYDLKTGLLQWTAGAAEPLLAEAGQPDALATAPLGETFFYSAPLPVDGQLFVVGEERRQVQLFNLDPATGEVDWSVALLNPDPTDDLVLDEDRRLSGLMPAYSSGLLICPTGSGVLTAVDVVQRRVVWTHQYAWSDARRQPGRFPLMAQHSRGLTAAQTAERFLIDDRWFDHRVIVSGVHVLFAPPDAEKIVCLNLLDGKPAWPAGVGPSRGAYIAAVHQNRVIIVDRHDVYALNLENGSPAWRRPVSIPAPAGRGVVMGDILLQPVATGEIVVVDLIEGQVLGSSKLPDSLVAGNLAAARGHLITQTGTEVIAFRSRIETEREIERRLSLHPDDAAALTARGKLRLFSGDLQNGIVDLQKSLALRPDPATKQLLRTTLLEGLRSDYDQYSRYVDELDELIESPADRAEFFRIQVLGLEDSDPSAAMDHLLTLFGMQSFLPGTRHEDSRWSVRNDCWIRARISDLLDSAMPVERERLLQKFEAWYSKHLEDSTPQAVAKLRYLPADWISEELLIRALQRLREELPPSQETMLTLHCFAEHSAPAVRAVALAGLIEAAIAGDHAEAAKSWLDELRHLPGDVLIEEERTITELADQLTERNDLKELLKRVPNWPRSLTMSKEVTGNLSSSQWYPIPVFSRASNELEGWSFYIEGPGYQGWALDASGRMGPPIDFGIDRQERTMPQLLVRYVSTVGPLACFVLYDRAVLVDVFGKEIGPSHMFSLIKEGENLRDRSGRSYFPQRPVPGMRTPVSEPVVSAVPGNVSTLTPRRFCYGVGSDLVAVDPATTRELWRKKNIPAGSEIIADDDAVVVRPPDSSKLLLFRAEDGASLGMRDLPAGVVEGGWRKADWGRMMPCVQVGETFTFSLVDPVDGHVKWKHTGPPETVWAPVDRRDVAFLEPTGRFVVRDGATGRVKIEHTLSNGRGVQSMRVLDFPEQWIVLTNTSAPSPQADGPDADDASLEVSFMAAGPAFAIDRATGRLQWTRELNNLSIPLDVPTRWPVLLFSAKSTPIPGVRTPFGTAPAQPVEVVAVNRFTGHEAGRQEARDEVTSRWQGATEPTFKIQYRRGHRYIVLVPADEPAAPQAPAPGEQTEPNGND